MDKIAEKIIEKYPRFAGWRIGFIDGYRQAEKDLALTWEDIQKIVYLTDEVQNEDDFNSLREKYQEVLRRFNEQREKK